MTSTETRSSPADDLHRRAEEKAGADEAATRELLSPEKAPLVLHELRVHQIELEIQNEELRRAQAELEASRARYFDLYDLAPVGYFTLSEQGLILEANLTAAGLLGVARSALVKRPLTRFIFPEDQDIYYRHRQQLFEAGAPQVYELRLLRTNADPFWAQVEATAAQDADGAPVCRAVVSDITERKQAEQALQEANERLERRVAERTADLAASEKELRDKNAELERFTYTVSHELRSPLVTVKTFLGYLEADLARPDPDRVKQDLLYVHTATNKMGQLLDELLELTRVGRKANPPVRVTFQDLAHEAVRLVAGRITASAVEVQVTEAAVALIGDRPRFVEIWQNLVENACKFMGNQAKPCIHIGVEARGAETVFFVRDNGAGIDPRYQSRVFGLFEKLDPRSEGTGLGLALVKRIVELYEGRIWVESEGPGQGANFQFTLPGAVRGEIQGAIVPS